MSVEQQMRDEWNERAREDAYYYAGFGGRGQAATDFLATGVDIVPVLAAPLRRLAAIDRDSLRALEIGCGPGRLLQAMHGFFGEIHGVDVSDEMVLRARENTAHISHAHVHQGSGADLRMFASNSFHYIYSYAVFQHIPEREVVLRYLEEGARVLCPAGIMHCQFRGVAPNAFQAEYQSGTWNGCVFSAEEMYGLARRFKLQLVAVSGAGTQYLWATFRKPPRDAVGFQPEVRLDLVCATHSPLPVAPVSGLGSAITMWTRGLSDLCDLTNLTVSFDGAQAPGYFLGPLEGEGCHQFNAEIPAGTRTGLVPVKLCHDGAPITPPHWIRIVPAMPWVPQVLSIRDGRSLALLNRIESGYLCLRTLETPSPTRVRMNIAGREAAKLDQVCMDPIGQQQEFTFQAPEGLPDGEHIVTVLQGEREIYRALIAFGAGNSANRQADRSAARTA